MGKYKLDIIFGLQIGLMFTLDFSLKSFAIDIPFLCLIYSWDREAKGFNFNAIL